MNFVYEFYEFCYILFDFDDCLMILVFSVSELSDLVDENTSYKKNHAGV